MKFRRKPRTPESEPKVTGDSRNLGGAALGAAGEGMKNIGDTDRPVGQAVIGNSVSAAEKDRLEGFLEVITFPQSDDELDARTRRADALNDLRSIAKDDEDLKALVEDAISANSEIQSIIKVDNLHDDSVDNLQKSEIPVVNIKDIQTLLASELSLRVGLDKLGPMFEQFFSEFGQNSLLRKEIIEKIAELKQFAVIADATRLNTIEVIDTDEASVDSGENDRSSIGRTTQTGAPATLSSPHDLDASGQPIVSPETKQ